MVWNAKKDLSERENFPAFASSSAMFDLDRTRSTMSVCLKIPSTSRSSRTLSICIKKIFWGLLLLWGDTFGEMNSHVVLCFCFLGIQCANRNNRGIIQSDELQVSTLPSYATKVLYWCVSLLPFRFKASEHWYLPFSSETLFHANYFLLFLLLVWLCTENSNFFKRKRKKSHSLWKPPKTRNISVERGLAMTSAPMWWLCVV